MASTIGNPLSWAAQTTSGTTVKLATKVGENLEHLTHGPVAQEDIRLNELTNEDLKDALRLGMADLGASRTDAMYLVILYPIMGLILSAIAFNAELLPLLFPIATGFALLGPLAAVGLYEISRRRERGESAGWGAVFDVFQRPNVGALVVLGLTLCGVFVAWMTTAYIIFLLTVGPEAPTSVGSFAMDVFTTGAGWAMIVVGCAVGFVFAVVVLACAVVSFPLLLDRSVGVPVALQTSIRLTQKNPRVVLTWGFIVAGALFLGSIPAFIGLILALPFLGHATWHLYRRAVSLPEES